jgi:hypothetical protein
MKLLILLFLFSSLAFSQYYRPKWGPMDEPIKLIAENYKIKFRDLPVKGQLENVPWSDTYWPTYMGGISWRWASKEKGVQNQAKYPLLSKDQIKSFDISTLSPAEKYDLLMGDEKWTLTNLERQRTGIMTEKNIPGWFGLCHAWAPATMLYLSPKPYTLNAPDGTPIPFYAADIKALLTYNLHLQGEKTTTYFMGSRCDVAIPKLLQALSFKLLTEEKYLSMTKNENCKDMDAGAFHLALATMLGIKKTGFVMDMTRGSEVWNQPVYAFQTKILKEGPPKKKIGRKEDILDVNKVLTVITNVVYIGEIQPNKDGENYPKISLKDVNYKYEIHLNAEGNIIGGKWLMDARPDFFWRSLDPGYHPLMARLPELYADSTTGPYEETRRHSVGQIKGLFKQTAKNIINAKRFLKTSQELAIDRRGKRIDFYTTLKDEFIKNVTAVTKLFGF